MANILYENGFPIKAIVNGKLVDVQEVRHGSWKNEIDTGTEMMACSVCGARVVKQPYISAVGRKGYAYCPYCGAKLDEEDQPKRFWPEQVEKIMIEAIAKTVTHKDTEEDPDD